jgi:hypothetical protein
MSYLRDVLTRRARVDTLRADYSGVGRIGVPFSLGFLGGNQMHALSTRMRMPMPVRALLTGLAVLALALAGMVALAPSATAAPVSDASASPTAVARYGTSTVTLRLDGESSTQSTPTDLVLVLDESGSIDATEWSPPGRSGRHRGEWGRASTRCVSP